MTPLGYFLVVIGLALFVYSEPWLYRMLVFWTLFSATAVANIGEGNNASALQAWMFFGALWLMRRLIRSKMGFFALDAVIVKPARMLMAFIAVAACSLAMPVLIHGRLEIASPILGEFTSTPLFLTVHHITQLLYLVFGALIAIQVAQTNLDPDRMDLTERVILISALFVAAWGLLQFACNVTGAEYPAFLFNNSESRSGKGFMETLAGGIPRISSVTVEPSMLAQGMVTLLPLVLPAILGKGAVFSLRADRWAAVLMIVVVLLCTSSTGYVSMVIFFMILIPFLLHTKVISKARALVIYGSALLVFLFLILPAFFFIPAVQNVVVSVLFDKASTGSGLERAMTIADSFGYFQSYPVLGIGWGSSTSHDLFVKLLSNVGIVGTAVFVAAIFIILRGNWVKLGRGISAQSLSRSSWTLSLLLFVLTSALIEFPLPFGNFWLVMGMAISTCGGVDPVQGAELAREVQSGPPAAQSAPL